MDKVKFYLIVMFTMTLMGCSTSTPEVNQNKNASFQARAAMAETTAKINTIVRESKSNDSGYHCRFEVLVSNHNTITDTHFRDCDDNSEITNKIYKLISVNHFTRVRHAFNIQKETGDPNNIIVVSVSQAEGDQDVSVRFGMK